jgi:hypothetical protein
MTMGAIQAAGQYTQGKVANINSQAEADTLEMQAAQIRRDAEFEAGTIRRQGAVARGQTLGGIVASGVRIGEGSALEAERQVMTDFEQDARMAMLTGNRQAGAAEIDAISTRRAGRAARRAASTSAVTTLLGTAAQSARAGGWRATGPGYSGSQMPAPVETRTIPRG